MRLIWDKMPILSGTANMEGVVARPIIELKDRRGKRAVQGNDK